jgi:glucokinase
MAHYLAEQGCPAPAAAAIGIASPVVDGTVTMTNLAWRVDAGDLQRRFGLERFVMLNDFAALARGLPTLGPDEVTQVGGGATVAGQPLALVGPGTGLGVSGLLAPQAAPVAVVGEGGHASLAAADAIEDRVLGLLRERFGHVSAERVLSGSGIVNLYRAGCELEGRAAADLGPAEITQRALADADTDCRRALDWFFGFLGGVAGDLALTLGARGGVYVAGGIVPRLGDAIERSSFRRRFEAKGRFESYLAAIPTWVIGDSTGPALRGANLALDDAAIDGRDTLHTFGFNPAVR